MNQLTKAAILFFVPLFLGICLFFSPLGQTIERKGGLALLFNLRGPRTPPAEVVIINIDHESAEKLALPQKLSLWPRTIHARLIDCLHHMGAAVITFDVHFAEPREGKQDQIFADAIQRAGNITLFEKLDRIHLNGSEGKTTSQASLESRVPPIALLASAAQETAPHPLPKLPVRINQTWIYKASAGGRATLPAVSLQQYGLRFYNRIHALITTRTPGFADKLPPDSDSAFQQFSLQEIIQITRAHFLENKGLQASLLQSMQANKPATKHQEQQIITALIRMYGLDESIYLNFYGPPGTITTLPYFKVLQASDDQLQSIVENKIIFIGSARQFWPEQRDGFYTVFSQADGLDLSGVELAATTCANLLDNHWIKPLDSRYSFGLFIVISLACLAGGVLLPPLLTAIALLIFSGAYTMTALWAFSSHVLWVPLLIPLTIQVPAAYLLSILLHYYEANKGEQRIKQALGYYLPKQVVKELANDLNYITTGDQMVYSTCLMTDAANYTTLSENMGPAALGAHMKNYFQHLFTPVKQYGGVVSDVVGDSMLALWPSTAPCRQNRQASCQAALQILKAIMAFNQANPETAMPTRVGLHFGYMLIGNIGAEDHFEYTPIGDTVNTASRIETLNKKLGTWLLASSEVIADLEIFLSRQAGSFLLSGKSHPIEVHEILALKKDSTQVQHQLCDLFGRARVMYTNKKWAQALVLFGQCLTLFPKDGPSHFYVQLCQKLMDSPPAADWSPTIRITK